MHGKRMLFYLLKVVRVSLVLCFKKRRSQRINNYLSFMIGQISITIGSFALREVSIVTQKLDFAQSVHADHLDPNHFDPHCESDPYFLHMYNMFDIFKNITKKI